MVNDHLQSNIGDGFGQAHLRADRCDVDSNYRDLLGENPLWLAAPSVEASPSDGRLGDLAECFFWIVFARHSFRLGDCPHNCLASGCAEQVMKG